MRISLLILLIAAPMAAQQPSLPLYRAGRTVDAIRIDGKLDEFSWAVAPRVGPFRLIHKPEAPPKFPTEGAVLWDAENLYVAFACRDSEPWSRMKKRDDHLWEEEVVEVFLDPDADGLNYPELEVSPNNIVVDLLIARPRGPLKPAIDWDIAGLRTAVSRQPAGWTAEMAIPWKSLAGSGRSTAPAVGDRWRIGLYRIKRPGGPAKADQIASLSAELKTASGARRSEIETRVRELQSSDEYSAWSPTRPERGYHDPERFGIIEFVEIP